ncbi:hypothetical protein [Pararobbsia silviterrae]|uniref:Uncharacterized protein n=1 Tax=Pararobbsia silviterrae TaxID=1792498 RepID=A0A494YE53_9BURK|nr:hypothetical protein [Pararobbsia silviterrae]RKP58623.1 hypothetical protein D7S86_01380 [Pararobbsia silviterrae]
MLTATFTAVAFDPDAANTSGLALASPTPAVGVAPGVIVNVQLDPTAIVEPHVVDVCASFGNAGVTATSKSTTAALPVFVKVRVRAVPVRAALVPISLTESTSVDALADSVVGEAEGVVDAVLAVLGVFDPPHAANALQKTIPVTRNNDFFNGFMTRPFLVCLLSTTRRVLVGRDFL